jgi:hypothetical protein
MCSPHRGTRHLRRGSARAEDALPRVMYHRVYSNMRREHAMDSASASINSHPPAHKRRYTRRRLDLAPTIWPSVFAYCGGRRARNLLSLFLSGDARFQRRGGAVVSQARGGCHSLSEVRVPPLQTGKSSFLPPIQTRKPAFSRG